MEKSSFENAPAHSRRPIPDEMRIQIMLEEYRALYGLLTFRLTAMDRRLPVAGGTLGTLLGATTAMPDETQLAFLLGLPIALLWLVLSTVQHARSKEDHLRRIDEIERAVNGIVGEELLSFQSRHPNERKYPGGRTGFAAVLAVISVALIMLTGCAWLMVQRTTQELTPNIVYYLIIILAIAMAMLVSVWRLSRYRYRRKTNHCTPIFCVRSWS